jgi:hypothetical protein
MGPLVLTRQEIHVIVFVLLAFLLGLGVKLYREYQPLPDLRSQRDHHATAHFERPSHREA